MTIFGRDLKIVQKKPEGDNAGQLCNCPGFTCILLLTPGPVDSDLILVVNPASALCGIMA